MESLNTIRKPLCFVTAAEMGDRRTATALNVRFVSILAKMSQSLGISFENAIAPAVDSILREAGIDQTQND